MKKLFAVLTVLILVGIFIPAVSAGDITVIDDTFEVYQDTSSGVKHYDAGFSGTFDINAIMLNNIENFSTLHYISVYYPRSLTTALVEGARNPIQYTLSGVTHDGIVYVDYSRNVFGSIIGTRFTIFLNDWDVGTLTGSQVITFNRTICRGAQNGKPAISGPGAMYSSTVKARDAFEHYFQVVAAKMGTNKLEVSLKNNQYYTVELKRNVNGISTASYINLTKNNNAVYSHYGAIDKSLNFYKSEIDRIQLTMLGNSKAWPLSVESTDPYPTNSTLTVYIKNSQTGALIANANVVIDALVNGTYYPVVNRTEPSGIFSINLQPTGGGQPNPDGYRLIVTADGYNNPMPEINFTVDDYKKYIYCLLDPIAGGPVNENKTFIDFFVRDMSANPISGATVKFGQYTLITNSAGYTVFEVDKNATYTYTVSKSGYGALTGNTVIGNDPRHTINTVLAPIVTPTTTTPIPTSPPIGPTPTMTAPTGEPVSNWLEWFAAHFGMILGGGAEIGKIFMWLCFTIPVGVYVGKESKAGAAGFMAGAGIVTLFFALIGWVPIWLLVLMALIIGLLYAKAFNNSDTGGGR